MKIAQVAPLYESVPPQWYGGTERIVSYLTEALVAMGHEVTLFASGDSVTRAQLRPMVPKSLRLNAEHIDAVADHLLMAERVIQASAEFDIIHSHIDYLPYSLWRRLTTPHLTTLHGRLNIPNLYPLYAEFSDIPVVSISNAQRAPIAAANWQRTIYHGLPESLLTLRETPGKYLAFLGRTSPEKGIVEAIAVAEATGMPLKIAAKIVDDGYFDAMIKPHLHASHIEFLGEIGEHEKQAFLGDALALLFLINWPEPFGLVMIEAMACGTPILACRRGSVDEIMVEGVTGFLVDTVAEAVDALAKLPQLSRARCREVFEQRFTARRMAEEYVAVYQQLIHANLVAPNAPTHAGATDKTFKEWPSHARDHSI